MKDKKKIILSVLGILMLVVVTVGVTFAVFTYTKLGTTENTVTTGTLKFLYTENTGVGAGINIENAFPVSDTVGKSYDTDKYVFDFRVEATNSGSEEIPYEVTLRKKSTSTLSESNIKVYLTDMTGDSDTQIVAPTLYSDLIQTTIDVGEEVEKTIYNGTVLGGELTYLKDFRLRMWIDENSNQDDINGKTFVALVNVYSNVALVSEEEMASRNDIGISSITVDDEMATKVENQKYDYTVVLPENTTTASVNIDTTDSNSSIKIEKLDSLTHNSSSIKKVASSRTLNLTSGDNYFKVTVISENKEKTEDYILKIGVLHVGYSISFDYTGDVQYFKTPSSGNYKIELWGASGSSDSHNSASEVAGPGNGAYTSGKIHLNNNTELAIYVGEEGTDKSTQTTYPDYGFNGGGCGNFTCYNHFSRKNAYNMFGGGATDIRLVDGEWDLFDSLKSRIMVAAGGSSGNLSEVGAAGGGINGYSGKDVNGATQTSSGGPIYGGFGYGGIPKYLGGSCDGNTQVGAGSGYYGGGASNKTAAKSGMYSAGSGSSFISGHLGCDAIDESSTSNNIIHTGQANHYSGYIFTDTVMIDGLGYKWTDTKGSTIVGQPTYDGSNTQIGNIGNGYAKITYLGK